jgi:peptide/nickel transport system substrate-binding protein
VATTPRLIASILLGTALITGTTGCRGSSTPPSGPAASGGALVASLRSEPRNYNRMFEPSAAADLVALLTQARLIRVNRATDTVEPGLAESWEQTPDGSALTLKLRPGLTFSDGAAFTSADVLFSLAVAYDAAGSVVGDGLKVGGQKLEASAPDAHSVAIRFPVPFAPGVRLLDNLPILPKHKLERAFLDGTIQSAWTPATPLSEIVGLGPFVLAEHAAGQRLVFVRNPRYWRRGADQAALPHLDRLTVEIIPDQNAEALRLESGATDLMSNGDIRAADYARFKRLADQGRPRQRGWRVSGREQTAGDLQLHIRHPARSGLGNGSGRGLRGQQHTPLGGVLELQPLAFGYPVPSGERRSQPARPAFA